MPTQEAPASAVPSSQQLCSGVGQSPRVSDESQQAALPQCGSQRDSVNVGGVLPRPSCASPVGFRAWVGHPHQPAVQDASASARHHCGLKRKADSASLRGAGPPTAGSRQAADSTLPPASSGALQHFSSSGTGGSSGTCARLGSGGLPGGSSARQGSALHASSVAASAAASQPSVALPPPPAWLPEHRPALHRQGEAQPSSLLDPGTSSAPQLLKQHGSQGNGHHHHHHHNHHQGAQPQSTPKPPPLPTVPFGDASAAAWDGTNGASAPTPQQLQQMHAVAASQQQQQAGNQQHSQAHQEQQGTAHQHFQQDAQMHGSYDSNSQCGAWCIVLFTLAARTRSSGSRIDFATLHCDDEQQ